MNKSIPLKGKKEALTLNTVPLLVNLLKDPSNHVRSKSALALEAIAITTEGKHSCIKENAIESLIALIDDPLSEARVNGLKVNFFVQFTTRLILNFYNF